jgi:purine-binding chemotaxis protein CheW
LRDAFDRSFSSTAEVERIDVESFVGIGVGDGSYAVRLSEIVGIHSEKRVARLPSPLPALLGVVGVRSGIVPVYSLRAFLGYGALRDAPRWFLIAGSKEPVGLAFERFDGQFKLGREALAPVEGRASGAHVREVARIHSGTRAVIDVGSIVLAVRNQVDANNGNKER